MRMRAPAVMPRSAATRSATAWSPTRSPSSSARRTARLAASRLDLVLGATTPEACWPSATARRTGAGRASAAASARAAASELASSRTASPAGIAAARGGSARTLRWAPSTASNRSGPARDACTRARAERGDGMPGERGGVANAARPSRRGRRARGRAARPARGRSPRARDRTTRASVRRSRRAMRGGAVTPAPRSAGGFESSSPASGVNAEIRVSLRGHAPLDCAVHGVERVDVEIEAVTALGDPDEQRHEHRAAQGLGRSRRARRVRSRRTRARPDRPRAPRAPHGRRRDPAGDRRAPRRRRGRAAGSRTASVRRIRLRRRVRTAPPAPLATSGREHAERGLHEVLERPAELGAQHRRWRDEQGHPRPFAIDGRVPACRYVQRRSQIGPEHLGQPQADRPEHGGVAEAPQQIVSLRHGQPEQAGQGLALAGEVGRRLQQHAAASAALRQPDELAALRRRAARTGPSPAKHAVRAASRDCSSQPAQRGRLDERDLAHAKPSSAVEQAFGKPAIALRDVVEHPRISGRKRDVEHQVVLVAEHRAAARAPPDEREAVRRTPVLGWSLSRSEHERGLARTRPCSQRATLDDGRVEQLERPRDQLGCRCALDDHVRADVRAETSTITSARIGSGLTHRVLDVAREQVRGAHRRSTGPPRARRPRRAACPAARARRGTAPPAACSAARVARCGELRLERVTSRASCASGANGSRWMCTSPTSRSWAISARSRASVSSTPPSVSSSATRACSVTSRRGAVGEHGDVVHLHHPRHAQRGGGDALGSALAAIVGSTCTVTEVRPTGLLDGLAPTACSTASVVSWLRSRPLRRGHADHDVREDLAPALAHAHGAHLLDARNARAPPR